MKLSLCKLLLPDSWWDKDHNNKEKYQKENKSFNA